MLIISAGFGALPRQASSLWDIMLLASAVEDSPWTWFSSVTVCASGWRLSSTDISMLWFSQSYWMILYSKISDSAFV